ncbi:hypothetical protein M408DRAFT_23003 [Serendipita vermifera MAFF 305830]|uniref:Uncharacterized protein n=1 Tax=Serendipita vermifera MAFF 305830 TaxID=933852 RepID=A0A0C2WSU2_SERVB|nr:hypothetical protein M408DRAFT_23003 [Serendipita vermifera MAFF 305830]
MNTSTKLVRHNLYFEKNSASYYLKISTEDPLKRARILPTQQKGVVPNQP